MPIYHLVDIPIINTMEKANCSQLKDEIVNPPPGID